MIDLSKQKNFPIINRFTGTVIFDEALPKKWVFSCRPRTDIMFDEDVYFLNCDYYPMTVINNWRLVISMTGLVLNGIVFLTEDEFNQYFIEEES